MLNNLHGGPYLSNIAYFCSMIRKIVLITAIVTTLTAHSQETVMSDSTLYLPTLNAYGQMPSYINRWSTGYPMGVYDWQLHQGLNMNLGACVFSGLGDGTPSGAGFAQNISSMYAVPLTNQLSLAFGGYFTNARWGSFNLLDAGVNALLGYRFNDRWEGYLYGQKSLVEHKQGWPFYDAYELGDRIGAAIRHNFSPSFSVQLNVEYGTTCNDQPPTRPQSERKHR